MLLVLVGSLLSSLVGSTVCTTTTTVIISGGSILLRLLRMLLNGLVTHLGLVAPATSMVVSTIIVLVCLSSISFLVVFWIAATMIAKVSAITPIITIVIVVVV